MTYVDLLEIFATASLLKMSLFSYVYLLVSIDAPERHYVGRTKDLATRLKEHNRGKCRFTVTHRPWKIETSIASRSQDKTRAFERYLKTGSGREFARRHF